MTNPILAFFKKASPCCADQQSPKAKGWTFTIPDLLLCVLFVFVSGMMIEGITHHAMWRDELQAWVIARDSATYWDLLKRLGFEGFPPLWHCVLKFAQIFSSAPEAMQGIHVLIAIANIFLIWRFLPLHPALKALLMLSFPFAYQFALFSRCYGITMTPLLLAVIAHDRKKPLLYWSMLGLAGQSTLLGMCVAGGLALHRLIENPKSVWAEKKEVCVFVLMTLFALAVAYPTSDRVTITDIGAHPTVYAFFQLFSVVPFLPLAANQELPFFWEMIFALSATLYGISFGFSWKNLVAWMAMLAAFLVINQFGYTLLPYHMMIASIGSLLIAIQSGSLKAKKATIAAGFLWLCLALQGFESIITPEQVPYSQGRNAANWIKENKLEDAFWISLPDYAGTTVAGYINRQFYFPQCKCTAAAPKWSKKNRKVNALPDELAEIANFMKETDKREVWLLLGTVWPQEAYAILPPPNLRIERKADFLGAAMSDEQFLIYKVTRTP